MSTARTPKNTGRKKPLRKSTATKKKSPAAFNWKIPVAALLLILLSPLYYGYVLRFFTSTFRWVKDIGVKPGYHSYDDFGVPIPANYKIHGIDVSYYQGKIDWQKVKSMREDDVSIKFAFIKATEGLVTVDSYFQRNWREAPKAGIVVGAYHFFRPTKNGKWQARFFLQNVKPEKGDLPLVVDVETLDGEKASKMRMELKAFVKHVEERTGYKPIIYANLSFYEDYLKGHFDGYKLWIANYYKSKLYVDDEVTWHFWQHSDKATIDGIGHVVDMNVFKGDSLDFERMLIR